MDSSSSYSICFFSNSIALEFVFFDIDPNFILPLFSSNSKKSKALSLGLLDKANQFISFGFNIKCFFNNSIAPSALFAQSASPDILFG